jgi:hypothetical protein
MRMADSLADSKVTKHHSGMMDEAGHNMSLAKTHLLTSQRLA